MLKINLLLIKVKTFFYSFKCRYWNWRLPLDTDSILEEWQKIDHRKDRSLSGKDFRLYVYKKKLR